MGIYCIESAATEESLDFPCYLIIGSRPTVPRDHRWRSYLRTRRSASLYRIIRTHPPLRRAMLRHGRHWRSYLRTRRSASLHRIIRTHPPLEGHGLSWPLIEPESRLLRISNRRFRIHDHTRRLRRGFASGNKKSNKRASRGARPQGTCLVELPSMKSYSLVAWIISADWALSSSIRRRSSSILAFSSSSSRSSFTLRIRSTESR